MKKNYLLTTYIFISSLAPCSLLPSQISLGDPSVGKENNSIFHKKEECNNMDNMEKLLKNKFDTMVGAIYQARVAYDVSLQEAREEEMKSYKAKLKNGQFSEEEFNKQWLEIKKEYEDKFQIIEVRTIIEERTKLGNEVNTKDEKGRTPLHIAIENGNIEMVKLLTKDRYIRCQDTFFQLGHMRVEDNARQTLLHYAVKACCNNDIEEEELNKRLDLFQELVQVFIKKRPMTKGTVTAKDKDGKTAFDMLEEYMPQNDRRYVPGVMREYMMDLYTWDTLSKLVYKQEVKDVKDYLENLKATSKLKFQDSEKINNPDILGRTPLHLALEYGKIETANVLIEYGAPLDLKDRAEKTAIDYVIPILHRAVKRGDKRQVKRFIKNMEPEECLRVIHAQDREGKTVLHHAVWYRERGITCYIIAKELKSLKRKELSSITMQDKSGAIPLHYAAKNCGIGMVVKLYKSGSTDVNVKDNDDKTPLHYAVENHLPENKKEKIVKYLIKKGADTNAKDKNGKTPYDIAKERGVLLECFEKTHCKQKTSDDYDKCKDTPL